MTKHNKKRNVGIIYELLVQYISNSIIEGNISDSKKATRIIEKRFAKGTELYKEFRLFNALANSTASDTHIVASILSEAKRAARNINDKKLNKEKSLLIRDINHKINKKDFFYQNIPNYRNLGSIQIALNEWKKDSPDIKVLIEFEKKIGEILLENKKVKSFNEMKEELDASKTDKLILKLMTEKINQKYSHFGKDEREIISHYVFYSSQDPEKLKSFLLERKKRSLYMLENFEDNESNNILIEKVDKVRSSIRNLDENKVDDKSIVKFLTLTKLIKELSNKENNNGWFKTFNKLDTFKLW